LVAWRGGLVPPRTVDQDAPPAPTLETFVTSLATLYAGSHDYERLLARYRDATARRLRRHFGLPAEVPLDTVPPRAEPPRGPRRARAARASRRARAPRRADGRQPRRIPDGGRAPGRAGRGGDRMTGTPPDVARVADAYRTLSGVVGREIVGQESAVRLTFA